MPDVGIRGLKERASEIVRQMREERARYVITHRGRPVGLLIPLDEADSTTQAIRNETNADAWEELIRLGKEIGRGGQSSKTSTELLSEMRR